MSTKPIIVCHIVNSLDTGGMENGVINLCNMIDREQFKPIICCLKNRGTMADRVKANVEMHEMEFHDGFRIMDMIRLARKIAKLSPHIVHTHGWGGGSFYGVISAKLACVPAIINGEHGAFFLKHHQIVAQRVLDRLLSKHLSVSENLKMKIKDNLGIAEERIIVIQNGVDIDLFSGGYNTYGLRKELSDCHGVHIDDDCMVIGSIGSLKIQKNQIMLLEALNEMKGITNNKQAVLFIGVGPDLEILQRYVAEKHLQDRVAFLGLRDDVPYWLSIMDLVVSTSISTHEGLSNVILEAMSSGRPVISTESVGSSEIITNGFNGFLIDPHKPHQLCEKLMLLQNNRTLLQEMGSNARKHVHCKFSLKKMVSSYEMTYREASGRRNL
jgi:glycosyltransferase involved in cell wall biosynthesis